LKKKSLKTLRQKAWKACSLYIRYFYSDSKGCCTCYTCGRVLPIKEIQAGHAIGGRSNSVLFDTDIIRPQCPVCNIWNRGMYAVFALKLIKENGVEWFERKLMGSKLIVKMTREDYENLTLRFDSMREGL